MEKLEEYKKAFAAAGASIVTLATMFGVNPEMLTTENVGIAATGLAAITALVYQLRNGKKP